MKGRLIIISSPSGGGKGTLIREVLRSVAGIGYSVSYTTRPRRDGEIDGVHYNFVTIEEFEKIRDSDGFLEYAKVHGNYYGTSRSLTEKQTDDGLDVILEIDVQGAALVRAKMPDAVSIFILPPSFDVLKARLTARATENDYDLQLRLSNSASEVHRYKDFEYVVINDTVAAATERLRSIIIGERQRWTRQTDVIRDILDSFGASKRQEILE